MRHLLAALAGPERFEWIDPAAVCDAPAISEAIAIGGEWFEFPELSAKFGFHEALPSWNVDLPAGTGFCVELRVGSVASRPTWSPWMGVGGFGVAPVGALKIAAYRNGTVEIDLFRSTRRHDRVQLRMRAFGSRCRVMLRRLSVCLSDREGALTYEAPVADAVRLSVPFRSQRTEAKSLQDRICSPTSVAMLLGYRGVRVRTGAVAERLFDPLPNTYGNWSRAVQGAYSFGIPGLLARFSSWPDVTTVLSRGQPLIISIGVRAGELTGAPYVETRGHLLVATGLDRKRGLLVNDPAAPDEVQGCPAYSLDEMEQVWLRRGGTAFVLLPIGARSQPANR